VALEFITDVLAREYFASVIGPFRAPFGVRGAVALQPGASAQVARNTTRDRVLFITVSRSDVGGGVPLIFTRNDQGSTNDFQIVFGAATVLRFVLRPDESLTITNVGAITPALVIGQETF
jgi:hypothetical protein